MNQTTLLKWAVVMLFPAMLVGQSRQSAVDPAGWTKAKWGMTEKQIKAAFPDAKQVKDADGDPALGISGYAIGPVKYTVTFWFSESGGLRSVNLDPEEQGPRHAVAEWVKMNLLQQLTDTYRTPTQVSDEKNEHGGGSTRKWSWLFPKTNITLTFITYRDDDFKHLDKTYLIYSKVERQKGL